MLLVSSGASPRPACAKIPPPTPPFGTPPEAEISGLLPLPSPPDARAGCGLWLPFYFHKICFDIKSSYHARSKDPSEKRPNLQNNLVGCRIIGHPIYSGLLVSSSINASL